MKVKNLNLQPAALIAELVGTFILATVAITVGNPIYVGFTLVVLVLGLGAVSGAHLNPAVTFGLWSTKKLDTVRVPFYLAMQFAGALLALLLMQQFKGTGFGLSFASFNSVDWRLVVAEIIGTAILVFTITTVINRKYTETAVAMGIGFALLAGLAVGGGLIGQAAQNTTMSGTEVPRIAKVDGVILNPAIAIAAAEKPDQSNMQAFGSEEEPQQTQPASRFTLSETLLGALFGGVIGAQLAVFFLGESPLAKKSKKEKAVVKVKKVFKKGKK